MENDEKYILLKALLPKSVEMVQSQNGAIFQLWDNSCEVIIIDDNSFTVNGKRVTFNNYSDIEVNARLVSLILQFLDGNKRV